MYFYAAGKKKKKIKKIKKIKKSWEESAQRDQ